MDGLYCSGVMGLLCLLICGIILELCRYENVVVFLIVYVCEYYFEDFMRVVFKVLLFFFFLNVCIFWKW